MKPSASPLFLRPLLVTGIAVLGTVLFAQTMAGSAIAQNRNARPTAAAKTPAAKVQEDKKPAAVWRAPPYEARLLRLSELMGALSYLEMLCDTAKRASWRSSMQQLLDVEAKNPTQKARLAGAFNAGFRGYQLNYRTCTDNARVVIARSVKEGEKIAQDVANRYGGG